MEWVLSSYELATNAVPKRPHVSPSKKEGITKRLGLFLIMREERRFDGEK